MGARFGALTVAVVLVALGALLGSAISQRMGSSDVVEGIPAPRVRDERVRVEVLNGGGRMGMARSATDALRDRGFDVVYYGNAQAVAGDSSLVLDRVGRLDLARDVADALDIPRVASQPDSNLYLDVTVVLGEDWSPSPRAARFGSAPQLPWWSPKRWLPREDQRPSGPIADPGSDGG